MVGVVGFLYYPAMVRVVLTRHLRELFPDLDGRELHVEARTVTDVVHEMDKLAPGLAFYVCDERGRLRQHVNIFVGEDRIADRAGLTDPVAPDSQVFIMQALSGG